MVRGPSGPLVRPTRQTGRWRATANPPQIALGPNESVCNEKRRHRCRNRPVLLIRNNGVTAWVLLLSPKYARTMSTGAA